MKPKSTGYFYGNAYAITEGWALIQSPAGAWSIRAIKERGIFQTDEDAQAFVAGRANGWHAAYYHDALEITQEVDAPSP
jgi:hypothetical protein